MTHMISRQIAKKIIACFRRGGKVILFGNGGSLTDCAHFAGEFHGIGPVLALTDYNKITSIANDYGFEHIFSKQVADIGKKDDLVIGVSSSGKSKNVTMAMAIAKSLVGAHVMDWPRKGNNTQEVQNYQYKLFHDVYLEVKKEIDLERI